MVLLVMGYTGPTAMRFKEAYIAAFNAMEAQLKGQINWNEQLAEKLLNNILDLLNNTNKIAPYGVSENRWFPTVFHSVMIDKVREGQRWQFSEYLRQALGKCCGKGRHHILPFTNLSAVKYDNVLSGATNYRIDDLLAILEAARCKLIMVNYVGECAYPEELPPIKAAQA